MAGVFVTGTDTDAGKTFVTRLLARGLREASIPLDTPFRGQNTTGALATSYWGAAPKSLGNSRATQKALESGAISAGGLKKAMAEVSANPQAAFVNIVATP